MLLLERDSVLGELDALAAAARDGRGAAVGVTGEAGIGKTSLASAVAERQAGQPLDRRLRRAPLTRLGSISIAAAAVACLLVVAPFELISEPVQRAAERWSEDKADEDVDALDVALMEAAEDGDLRKMQRLLQRGAKANAGIRGDGSPLIAAARHGHLEAMKTLIDHGAEVNRGVRGDGTPLLNAAREGQLEAVRFLLARGADIDRGVLGDGNALIMAAGAGHVDVVRFLLDEGADIEAVIPGDENPLIHASESGQVEVVRLLITRGANVNARVWAEVWDDGVVRGEWRTPLKMATRNHHDEIVQVLRAAGARE